nr:MAG TPA: hypothetical protein [Crassvirales sp.]
MTKEQVIKTLVANGAEQVKNLKVRNVNVSPQENYVRLGITLEKPVKGYVTDDEGATYHEGEVNTIFVSLYSVLSILKDDDDAAFAVNHLLKNPDSMAIILSRAVIDIVQEKVTSGQLYKNPWSDNAEETTIQHDTIFNHITGIKLSNFAIRKLDKVADALLGL